MNRLAVLGTPIAHSRSPAMQNAALAELGLDGEWSYEAIEVASERFEATITELPARGFAGVNVTIPHKRAALAAADRASQAAREIGAANTLSFDSSGIRADNTDAPGLIAALPVDPAGAAALVLGAGGAGRASIWALRQAGAEVSVWNRTPERAALLAAELGATALKAGEPPRADACEILVNATAIGLERLDDPSKSGFAPFKSLGLDADQISDRLVVVDLVYGAAETELVTVAKERRALTVDGLEVLVRQGAESLRIWTGLDPPLETMRRAVRDQHS